MFENFILLFDVNHPRKETSGCVIIVVTCTMHVSKVLGYPDS